MNATQLIRNVVTSRAAWLSKFLDPRRDIAKECGHPDAITIQDYATMFARGDVAARVVSLFPEESWADNPDIYETEDEKETAFEVAFKELLKTVPLFTYLNRADTLSGIGRFGVILLGFDDGLPLKEPVAGMENGVDPLDQASPTHKLLYMRPLSERIATINAFETDVTSPRYGLPTMYELRFSEEAMTPDSGASIPMNSEQVHWTRIIHIADNRTNSEVYGLPRMEKVYNRLLDLRKIAGGSGEMFWKGGFPGLSIESQPGADEDIEFDKDATREQIEGYMNGMQRYLATVGMTAKSLSVQVADPLPHLDLQLRLIATALGVPMRVFQGSERGELASSQDTVTWNKRIGRRRVEYLTPFIIRPLVDRLIAAGVLPAPAESYEVDWPDMNIPGFEAKALIADQQTTAMQKYVTGGVDTLMPPFHYLTLVLGLSDEEATSVIDAAEVQVSEGSPLIDEKQAAADAALAAVKAKAPPIVMAPNGKVPGRPQPASGMPMGGN